ncbi:hypothetical protein KEM52_005019 [Ascosphaera acerosa]|nr:hypothetical protein KEM52_005019 [Ascosphaera acerosa]
MIALEHTRTSDVMANSQSLRDLSADFKPDSVAAIPTKRAAQPLHGQDQDGLATVPEMTEDDLDYRIDTSVIEQNLPHISSAEENDEDADDDMSVEVGRGGKPFAGVEDSRDTMMSLEESQIILSPIIKPRSAAPVAAPVLQNRTNRKGLATSHKENLRKDAAVRRAGLASTKEREKPGFGGRDSTANNHTTTNRNTSARVANKGQRRTLADVHEKIRDAYDGSYLSDERPQPRNIAASKVTRFSKHQLPNPTANIKEAVALAAAGANRKMSADRRSGGNSTNTVTDTQTRLSFVLPDVENLSELVSGIMDTGSRHAKPRATRFAASQAGREPQRYATLGSVPIPDDEKVVFASLRHLQEQVAALRADRGRLEELERENAALKAGSHSQAQIPAVQEQPQRKPTYISSDENDSGPTQAKVAIERHRLEAANLALQQHLEQAQEQVASLETALSQAEHEKENALNQRGAAYFASRELKLHNEELLKENGELRARVNMLTELLKSGGSAPRQHAVAKDTVPDEARSAQTQDMASDNEGDLSDQQSGRKGTGKARQPRKDAVMLPSTNTEEFAGLFSFEIPYRSQRSRTGWHEPEVSSKEAVKNTTGNAEVTGNPNRNGQRQEDVPTGRMRRGGRRLDDTTRRDLTFLNFLDASEIARLRKEVEEERLMQRNKLLQRDPTMTGPSKPALRRTKSDATRTGITVDEAGQMTQAAGKSADAVAEVAAAEGLPEPTAHDLPADENTRVVPRPVPVSERAGDRQAGALVAMRDEPTQRPAQSPAVALATVLKNLEDEVKLLKSQLETSQTHLRRHDASMGKKQRKSLMRTIEALLHDIDTKSDQIYALYDVLEGQKAAGTEMTDEEVEITIRDVIGGVPNDGDLGQVQGPAKAAAKAAGQAHGADETAESWNGFDHTDDVSQPEARKESRVSI